MKTFNGTAPHSVTVTYRGGKSHPLNPRLDVRNHSPTGFSWGYAGSGPSQLALAILCAVYDEDFAKLHYMRFKAHVITRLPRREDWVMTGAQVEEHMTRILAWKDRYR